MITVLLSRPSGDHPEYDVRNWEKVLPGEINRIIILDEIAKAAEVIAGEQYSMLPEAVYNSKLRIYAVEKDSQEGYWFLDDDLRRYDDADGEFNADFARMAADRVLGKAVLLPGDDSEEVLDKVYADYSDSCSIDWPSDLLRCAIRAGEKLESEPEAGVLVDYIICKQYMDNMRGNREEDDVD